VKGNLSLRVVASNNLIKFNQRIFFAPTTQLLIRRVTYYRVCESQQPAPPKPSLSLSTSLVIPLYTGFGLLQLRLPCRIHQRTTIPALVKACGYPSFDQAAQPLLEITPLFASQPCRLPNPRQYRLLNLIHQSQRGKVQSMMMVHTFTAVVYVGNPKAMLTAHQDISDFHLCQSPRLPAFTW
jgi:hypothetical protein